jgi:hypothetical protein
VVENGVVKETIKEDGVVTSRKVNGKEVLTADPSQQRKKPKP